MTTENLWGDFLSETGQKQPVAILREQASILGTMTDNLLEGRVHQKSAGDVIILDFRVVAPALDGYQLQVAEIRHKIQMYPLFLFDGLNDEKIECENEESFKQSLGTILKSEKVQRSLGALITQSRFADSEQSEDELPF